MGSTKIAGLVTLAVVFSWLIAGCVYSASSTTPAAASQPAATGELTKSQRLAVRWIEVSLAAQKVFLHDGEEIAGAYLVSTGVVTSPDRTTYPGTYWVRTMWPGPEETSPGVFVYDIIVFDWAHGNGFHSLPVDRDGTVLDPTLGKPASAGCIRSANSSEIYRFAETGMKVVIH